MAGSPAEQAVAVQAAAAAARGHVRASHADRERAVGMLKAAYVGGQLTKEEFDARLGQAFASRTYAELAAVTSIPARQAPAEPPAARPAPRSRQVSSACRWGSSGFVIPAILATGFALASAGGGDRYEVLSLVVALGYFLFWLSVGADLLWQYHCSSVPSAKLCVRCGHTVASHRSTASCQVRQGSVDMWRRCDCAGYVPPGRSPGPAAARP
jgi:hypothetical protein